MSDFFKTSLQGAHQTQGYGMRDGGTFSLFQLKCFLFAVGRELLCYFFLTLVKVFRLLFK